MKIDYTEEMLAAGAEAIDDLLVQLGVPSDDEREDLGEDGLLNGSPEETRATAPDTRRTLARAVLRAALAKLPAPADGCDEALAALGRLLKPISAGEIPSRKALRAAWDIALAPDQAKRFLGELDERPTAPGLAAGIKDGRITHIALCPEHGLHGERTECYVCGGPVEQVPMVPAGSTREAPRAERAAADALDAVLMRFAEGENPTADLIDKAADLVSIVKRDAVPAAPQGHDWERTSQNLDGGGVMYEWACRHCDRREPADNDGPGEVEYQCEPKAGL